jgi:hypothetical protein
MLRFTQRDSTAFRSHPGWDLSEWNHECFQSRQSRGFTPSLVGWFHPFGVIAWEYVIVAESAIGKEKK